jgi:hypothetical protein
MSPPLVIASVQLPASHDMFLGGWVEMQPTRMQWETKSARQSSRL